MQLLARCFLVLIFISGCSFSSLSSDGPLETSLGECAPSPCVKVAVSSMPQLPANVSSTARPLIDAEVRRVLYAPLDIDSSDYSSAAILRELKERLEEQKGLTDAPIVWQLHRSAAVLFSSPELISVEVLNEGYLGGAHAFKERSLMTFDSKSGVRLSVGDVIEDKSQAMLSKIVEAEFRRSRDIPTGQSLQDAGFFILPGQQVPLGENFALTDSFLEIQYNPYEIAPYALGETRIKVPREAVEPLVKADIRGVFSSQAAQGKH